MVLPEMFGQEDRASGVMYGTASMSIFSVLCNGSMLSLIEGLGGGGSDEQQRRGAGFTFLLYALLYSLSFVLIYQYLPETKNRSLGHP